jgi:hypothetical protein
VSSQDADKRRSGENDRSSQRHQDRSLLATSDHHARENASPNSRPSDFSWNVRVMMTQQTIPRTETAMRARRDLSGARRVAM